MTGEGHPKITNPKRSTRTHPPVCTKCHKMAFRTVFVAFGLPSPQRLIGCFGLILFEYGTAE